MKEEYYHVMTLSPRQQASLRLLLFNLYCAFIQKTMQDLENDPSEVIIKAKTQSLLKNFSSYEGFAVILSPKEAVHKAQPRFVTLAENDMKSISLSIDAFDDKNSYLEKFEVDFINSEMKKLSDLVQQSEKFTYTMGEINKMGGK